MEHQHHEKKYTCPMHPDVIQDKPGNCPKCGMNLILINGKVDEQLHQHHEENKKGEHSGHELHSKPAEKKDKPAEKKDN